jgi:3-mercaptopropionate dioxygenase
MRCAAVSYRSHTLHVEPDGSFSIVALLWRPGQLTRIHDHVTWCAFGVIQGVEHEELFDADLNLVGRNENQVGGRQRFRAARRHPPRAQHQRDDGDLHPHLGTDIARIGSSARRYYYD